MKLLLKLLIYTSSSLLSLTIRAESHNVVPLSQKTSQEYDLDRSFYSKTTAVQGILIASSAQVTDTAHLETAYLFDRLMSELREQIAQRIREKKVLCLLVGHQELTSDLPQFKSDKTGKELDFYNWRQRGFLTKINDRYVVLFAEEDVMEYVGGMQIESILIHEFGHVIHGVGFDEALKKQWTRAYMTAKAKGLWNDGRAAQRFRRVEGDTPVLLLDALVESFPEQPRSLLINCLNGGDVLVNGKATHAFVKVTEKDQVLIQFGGQKECYASKTAVSISPKESSVGITPIEPWTMTTIISTPVLNSKITTLDCLNYAKMFSAIMNGDLPHLENGLAVDTCVITNQRRRPLWRSSLTFVKPD